jgi:hypothetical protein
VSRQLFGRRECPFFSVGFPIPYENSAEENYSIEGTPSAGTAFTNSYADWREGTYELFKEWSLKQHGLKEPDSDDDTDVPVHLQKAKDIPFERNTIGDFILPPLSNFRTVRQKQRVVRAYIGAVYSMDILPILFCVIELMDRGIHG